MHLYASQVIKSELEKLPWASFPNFLLRFCNGSAISQQAQGEYLIYKRHVSAVMFFMLSVRVVWGELQCPACFGTECQLDVNGKGAD